ncbi:MAG: hypothetical protein FJY58_10515 [Betaproteobacteria bacterium]|nr:hypothetical protein [Betaproteobacteria bacterium]
MKIIRNTDAILLVIAGCLVVNTVVFALPPAFRAIKNEIVWVNAVRQKIFEAIAASQREREAQEEEAFRRAYAKEMCTKDRIKIYEEIIRSPRTTTYGLNNQQKIKINKLGLSPSISSRLKKTTMHDPVLAIQVTRLFVLRNMTPMTVKDCLKYWPSVSDYYLRN